MRLPCALVKIFFSFPFGVYFVIAYSQLLREVKRILDNNPINKNHYYFDFFSS